MTAKDVAAIAIRFFGIYLMVNTVLSVPTVIITLNGLAKISEQDLDGDTQVAIVGAFFVLGVVVSLVLFRLANSIASSVVDIGEVVQTPDQGFLLQLLGVFLIVSGLSSLPGLGFSILSSADVELHQGFYLIGLVFQIAVGCFLLIKPSVWKHWLYQLRGGS